MKKTIIALTFAAAAALAAPAVAEEAKSPKMTFTHEGVTYIYTQTTAGDSTIYKGFARPGSSFYLVASNGRVTGWVNHVRVAFDVADAKVEVVDAKPVTLASR